MPELPEVETVVRTLRPNLEGREITRVDIRHRDVVRYPGVPDFIGRLPGRAVSELCRRGKYICMALDDGQMLAAHMRMTGRLLYT
ncbi:MAG: DNA-formamidopyrimidine glycosylase, partial [Firmicutes bacterium]|nr:DNA-formamidopyrimidine glycosylase [Bacillota bacterium]